MKPQLKNGAPVELGKAVSGIDADGQPVKGTLVGVFWDGKSATCNIAVASHGRLIGDLKSENFSLVTEPAPASAPDPK